MFGRCFFVLAALAACAFGQSQVAAEQSRRLELALDEALTKQTLACDAEAPRPSLDFAFRFEIGYFVRCPLKEFGGVETTIAAYMRVKPGDGAPTWFTEWYRVPGIPNDVRSRVDLMRDHDDIEFSGAIGAGEGTYSVDLVIVDRQHRYFHRTWKTRVYAHGGEANAPVRIQPNTVTALKVPWCAHSVSERNLAHLTVLIDAAPIDAASTRLHACDRKFLVEALSSVVTLLPSNSMRVVAFNLDQQREVFRAEAFDIGEAHRFADALAELELAKVSYQVLQQSQGAFAMLRDLIGRESSERSAEAIILLGPTNRLSDKVPTELIADRRSSRPPIFYLKYSPITPVRFRALFTAAGMRDTSGDLGSNDGDFPDIIQHAAGLYDGVTISLHSPADLAGALRRIARRLRPFAQSEGIDR